MDLADQAYGHCLAVLGDAGEATAAATAALRRAGRSRPSVLAHARYQALARPAPPSPSPDSAAPDDLGQLARLLASTRPPVERAVLDLRNRLDRADLGRALGEAAGDAADRADAIGEVWDRELDPLLMARLGPGDCGDLAALLTDLDLTTLGGLAAAGPAVAGHVAACELCADRFRAMVSVRSLWASPEIDAPSEVSEISLRSRRMRPAAPPPPLDPRRRRPLLIATVAILAVALVVGAIATAAALTGPDGGRAKRVAKLVKVPTAVKLALTVRRDTVEVVNQSTRPVRWRATADAKWLQVTPGSGELAAGAIARLATRVLPSSPEGALHTTITVTGDDGSAAAAAYETTVERPPDLAATVEGCTVTATVEDASGVADATLHWSGGDERMAATATGYTGALPANAALTWWVSATDTRGNQARTAESQANC